MVNKFKYREAKEGPRPDGAEVEQPSGDRLKTGFAKCFFCKIDKEFVDSPFYLKKGYDEWFMCNDCVKRAIKALAGDYDGKS